MQTGKLRHRIACDAPVESRNDVGEAITTFVEQFKAAASIQPLRGRERLLSAQITADIDTRICVRWSPQTERITAAWRIRHGATVYNIAAPPAHIDMARREIEIMATTGLNQG